MFFKKTQIGSFVESWKKRGVRVVFFNIREIKKCFKDKLLHELLIELNELISETKFDGFSIVLEKGERISWCSYDSGRVALNLTLFNPKDPNYKKNVQEAVLEAEKFKLII